MATVSRADLARTLAGELSISKSLAKRLVDTFFELLTETIVEGDRIEARGFGVFTVKKTNAKPRARNPSTGEIVYVPARRKVQTKRIDERCPSYPSAGINKIWRDGYHSCINY